MTAADPITGASREQLAEIARPFPTDFVERKDGSDYVAHHVVNQRLLSIVGPFSFKLVEVLRGDVPAMAPDPSARSRRGKAGTPALSNVIVGGVWRLIAEIDGKQVEVEEVGDVGDVHNWPHDGARLKDAASDALKRCCMRLGLGLHLWAQEHYFLDQQLGARSNAPTPAEEPPQEPEPGGTGERGVEREAPAPATTPDRQTDGGTPPGFDHLTSPGRARAWLRGQPEEFRVEVEQLVGDSTTAGLADLLDAIETAWRKTRQAA